jgi:hypothetical protein
LSLYDEFIALRLLVEHLNLVEYEKIRARRIVLAEESRTSARRVERALRKQVDQLRSYFGVRADRSSLIQILRDVEDPEKPPVAYLRKSDLETMASFPNDPRFHRLPKHGRVGLSIRRTTPTPVPRELWLLEAKLFEDMCALYNRCQRQWDVAQKPSASPEELKIYEALLRATLVATFEFVESYLNGIAADYVLSHDDIDEGVLDRLTEGRRYLSLREKSLQYPRIYLGEAHPPIQESNCPELALLVQASDMRDAVVHASAIQLIAKELTFFNLRIEAVTELVDVAVRFVRLVEERIGRDSILLDWLTDRQEDGLFPPRTFD